MKKVLAVVIAVAFISMFGAVSNAQVPNMTIYFDPLFQETQATCEDHFFPEVDSLWVVLNNANMWVSTVEFSASTHVPGVMHYLGDSHLPTALVLGASQTGITITYSLPQNGYGPMLAMKIKVLWQDCVCEGIPHPLQILPHPGSGLLQAIEWQTFVQLDVIGMTSMICPEQVSTEETTWGSLKALYNN